MPTLHLLRHAKSDWGSPGLADHDRPLAERGRRAGALMAEHLRSSGTQVDLILCSSALRTTQTVELVLDAFDPWPEVVYEGALYGASRDELLQIVGGIPSRVDAAMIVGHNPGIEELAISLAKRGDPDQLAEMSTKYPTCALATLAWNGTWAEADDDAELVAFTTPSHLEVG